MNVEPYFTDIKEQLLVRLSQAKESILVAVAWLVDEDLIRSLSDAARRNINVSVVISNHVTNRGSINKYESLVGSGVRFFSFERRFLHHKFCIIDNRLLLTGSYNWSYGAIRNHEHIIILELAEGDEDSWMQRFVKIHETICKASMAIDSSTALRAFGGLAPDETGASALELEEIRLRREFEEDVRKSFAEASRLVQLLGIEDRMRMDGGGVRFVKRLIYDEVQTKTMKSGFEKLKGTEPHSVHLSFEYLVAKPKYRSLFSKEEIEFCSNLIRQYNLTPEE